MSYNPLKYPKFFVYQIIKIMLHLEEFYLQWKEKPLMEKQKKSKNVLIYYLLIHLHYIMSESRSKLVWKQLYLVCH